VAEAGIPAPIPRCAGGADPRHGGVGRLRDHGDRDDRGDVRGRGGEVPNGTYGGTRFSSAVATQKVDVAAVQGALKWDKAQYAATAGDVTFVVKNPGPLQHQLGIGGNGLMYESGNLDPNTTTNLTIMGLKAGTYDLVCNFPGHKAGGMVAKLAVA